MPQPRIVECEKSEETQKAPKVLKRRGSYQDAKKVADRRTRSKEKNAARTAKVSLTYLKTEKVVKNRTQPEKVGLNMCRININSGRSCSERTRWLVGSTHRRELKRARNVKKH